MFCAGLFLSIADLLELWTAYLATPAHRRMGPAQNLQHVPEAFPMPQEQGGTSRARAPLLRTARHAADNVSTIRRSGQHFNREVAANVFNLPTLVIPTKYLSSRPSVEGPCVLLAPILESACI